MSQVNKSTRQVSVNARTKDDFFNFCAYDEKLKNFFNDDEMNILYKDLSLKADKLSTYPRKSIRGSASIAPLSHETTQNNSNLKLLTLNKSNSPIKQYQKESEGRSSNRSKRENKKQEFDVRKNIQSVISGRNQLIIRLLKLAANKFDFYKESILSKGMKWLEKELNNILVYRSDEETWKIFNQNKKNASNDKENSLIGNYIKEFSKYQFNNEEQKKSITSNSPSKDETDRDEDDSKLNNYQFIVNNSDVNKSKKNSFNENRNSSKKSFDFIREINGNDRTKNKTNSFMIEHRTNDNFVKRHDKKKDIEKSKTLNLKPILSKQDTNLNDLLQSEESFIEGFDDNISTMSIKTIIQENEFINYNESHLNLIETCDFNIFLLENEVGKKNILSTIGIYIFQQYNYYSKIQFEKFENFIKEISEGYIRENPYHNVSYLIINI